MSKIIRITITGQDQPGLTPTISTIIAGYDLEILDIGQSVIHGALAFAMLARLPEPAYGDPAAFARRVLNDLRSHCHAGDLQFSYQPVTDGDYQYWLSGQGGKRYVVTLLSRNITTEHIARVSDITAAHGLNIERISRLSGRRSLHNHKNDHCRLSCLEFSVRGAAPDQEKLRTDFLNFADHLDADVAFQEESIYRRNRRLVVFDMDSTLIQAEVIDLLAEAAGVGEQVAAITEQAMQGALDFNDSFRARLGMLKGLDESVLPAIARQLPLTKGAETLICALRSLGYRTAIISGGFLYFARYLQERLGIDDIYANELEIVGGKMTGRVMGEIVNGEHKAKRLQQIAAEQGVTLDQVIAVGDGANDLPMLRVAGLGIAFRAKPVVKRSARQSISTLGLESILYLLGFSEKDLDALSAN